jgi:hypothetical protein
MATDERALSHLFVQIEQNEINYALRERLVYQALGLAGKLGYTCGIRVDPADVKWPIVCIDLPSLGEVSWHCPARDVVFSGYTTEQKYARTRMYTQAHQ